MGGFIYSGIRTFMGVDPTNRPTKYKVLGVPYGSAVTYNMGAHMGPSAIRDASFNLRDGVHPHYRTSPLEMGLCDAGDVQTFPDHGRSMHHVQHAVDKIEHPIVLGGDHSVTAAVVRSLHNRHGKLNILHFDAHCDTWDYSDGPNHGSWVREVVDEGVVDRVVQVGVRSPATRSALDFISQHPDTFSGISVADINDRHHYGSHHDLAHHAFIFLHERPVYLTFDIDALDPSEAPGTGTLEVGGLRMHKVLEFLRSMRPLPFVGMDVMEVLPALDNQAKTTALAAATLVWEYLCAMAYRRTQ